MNNEKMNQMIDEAYENYYNYMTTNFMETRWCKVEISPDGKSIMGRMCNRDEFIIESKTQPGFSERWGLKIEERELSDEERLDWMKKNKSKVILPMRDPNVYNVEFSMDEFFRPYGVPTKLITITYNGTIEIYE